jgi:dolichol-phosphate mannosyltransferase
VKRRPLYVVDRLTGFEEAIAAMSRSEATTGRPPASLERRFG